MKRFIFLLFAILLFTNINAQKFGTKIGLNLSGINTNINYQLTQEEAMSLLPGINGGFIFDFTPKHVGFVAEVLYSQKGNNITADTKLIDGTTDVETNLSLHLNYIEIPLMLKLKYGPAYVVAGPYFAYAMDGKEIVTMTVDGNELIDSQIEEQGQIPSSDVFKHTELNGDNVTFSRTDFGVNVGVGAEFLMLFAEARYGLGLSNINDFGDITSDTYTKNYTISFSVGIKFGK